MSTIIHLSIKSRVQSTRTISLSQNSSILELKQKINVVFDIEGKRQRLLFRGKLLQDGKHLLDYENLNDGKVIHMVVRPLATPRTNAIPPVQTSQFAFLTVDVDTTFRSLLRPPFGNSPFSPRQTRSPLSSLRAELESGDFFNRPSFIDRHIADETINFPVPPTFAMRLSRALAYMTELRAIMEAPVEGFADISHRSRSTSYRIIRQSRERLQRVGSRQSSQVALVLEELSDLMVLLIPQLTRESQSITAQQSDMTSISRLSRMMQILSLIFHFLGYVLSSAEPEITSPSSPTPPPPQVTPSNSNQQSPKRSRDTNENASSSSSNQKRQRTEGV